MELKDSIDQIIKDLKDPIPHFMIAEVWSYDEVVDLCSEYAERLEKLNGCIKVEKETNHGSC